MRWSSLGCVLLLVGCGPRQVPPAAPIEAVEVSEDLPEGPAPLFEGLGTYHRAATTTSPEAAKYIDQGMSFLFAFNHDEAARSFLAALELDPTATLAAWGIAAAQGPHINFPMVLPHQARAAEDALTLARGTAPGAYPVEQALVAAMDTRHAWPPPDDRRELDLAYADAMREVWRQFPDDPDVGALFAEAMMDLRPWDLWTPAGEPQPGTDEVVSTLEQVLRIAPDHPLANHLYIHAVEASPHPERAEAAADRLRTLQPGLGHLVHMPTHIDVRLGHWQDAIDSNTAAIEADRRYREIRPVSGLYEVYMAHNPHMLSFAAMMTGQSELAIGTLRRMVEEMPDTWAMENAAFADGYLAMPYEVLMRFGRWDEILAEPEPDGRFPIARSMRRYARGVAHAAEGRIEEAKAEQEAFLAERARVPQDAFFGNNTAADLLAIAEGVLAGEILFAEGKPDESFAALRAAVEREDQLRYSEPPDWIQPVRHPLGAALLRAHRAEEAEEVYRADLAKLPENVWSLVGLAGALKEQGKVEEATAVEARLEAAAARADIVLSSSCACLPGT